MPSIPQADSLFRVAEAEFASGEFANAAVGFSQVAAGYPLHQLTTAAAFMEARALYRIGAFERSVAAFDAFLQLYPSSSYIAEAERSRRLAEEAAASKNRIPLTLGVVLSMAPDEAPPTQALFNGIRLAIESHNASLQSGGGASRPVRMVFRDIGALGPAAAVNEVVNAGASVVVGALFSDQARSAARAAEAARVPFIAPLATDPEVSAGKRYAFQANVTIPVRGQLMARFAVNSLRIRQLGIVHEADRNSISDRMANAFAEEARALGADVVFNLPLRERQDWFRIDQILTADTLAAVRAIYVPVSGDQANRLAESFLTGMDQLLGRGAEGATALVRVLGNGEWHDLPLLSDASRYRVTYTNDFDPLAEAPSTLRFSEQYRDLTGSEPDRLATVGYDLATWVAQVTESVPARADAIRNAIADAPEFDGVGIRIHFNGQQVNQLMFYHRYRDGVLERMR